MMAYRLLKPVTTEIVYWNARKAVCKELRDLRVSYDDDTGSNCFGE